MKETTNIGLQKPEGNEYIDVDILNANLDKVDKEFEKVEQPTFDDTGTAEGISSFTDFMEKVKSKMNIFQFYRDFKAGMKYVLHTGRLANNVTTTQEGFALDARMGKVLQDQITAQNKNIGGKSVSETSFVQYPSSWLGSNGETTFKKVVLNKDTSDVTYIPANIFEGGRAAWWNVITFGISNRCTQIAFYGYNVGRTEVFYFRRQHDNNVSDWQKVITNSDLPIFQSFIVDPQGSDRIVLTLTNNADSGKVFATNGDVSAFNGYIKGVQIEHNTNKLTVFLSENRTGNIRINVMYMKL